MKKWKCSVCGYVHTGDTPPERCPVCGAPASKFVLLEDDAAGATEQTANSAVETDIIVVGSGAAAFAAAITARQLGAEVVMLEKAEQVGGTTYRSGGGFWIPNNRHQKAAGIVDAREDGRRYMARYSYPQLYNPNAERLGLPQREYDLICAYYDHAWEAVSYLENSGAFQTIMEINWTGQAQVDYMDHLPENKEVRGRSLYTVDDNGKLAMGYNMIDKCHHWADEHQIQIFTKCEARELRQDQTGRVSGVVALQEGQTREFRARKGVIFGSGGYSHNPELMLRFQRGPHYGGCAVPTNTGDFIKLAGQIGAAIGNTAGAFRAQSMIEVYLDNPNGSSNVFYVPGDSMLEVNKFGQRTMDEKRNYNDRGMTHFVWDPVRCEWTNMLQFLIFDTRTASLWQSYPPYPAPGETPFYLIQGENLDALSTAIAERLAKLAPHTGGFSLDATFAENLKATVDRFNDYARTGQDLEFGRGNQAYDREWTTFPPTAPNGVWPDPASANYTMYPLSDQGPYYAIILGAGTLDTNGGPLTDDHARVLDWSGQPIAGLYGAGNCIASPTANAYWGGGSTIGPGLAFGYLAARHAVTGS